MKMKKLLPILIALLFSACNVTTINDTPQAKTETILNDKPNEFGTQSEEILFTARERDFCLKTFEAYLNVDSATAKKREEFYKLMLKYSDSNDKADEDWYRKNIVHIDSVMRESIDLVKQDKSRQLLDLLESERYNIYGHPNADTYNCYALNSVFALLYAKYIESDNEYYAKLADLGEYSRMMIEAVQDNWEKPHPLYRQVVEELLQIYKELGNENKIAEMEALLEKAE